MYTGGTGARLDLSRANLRWNIEESRRFEVPLSRLEATASDAIRRVHQGVLEPDGPNAWRGRIRRSMSLFDQCDLSVTFEVAEDSDSATVVHADLAFEATSSRVAGMLWMNISVIGIPFALGWRQQSIRMGRHYARQTFDELWDGMQGPQPRGAYR